MRTCGGCGFMVEHDWVTCRFCKRDLAAPVDESPAPPTATSEPSGRATRPTFDDPAPSRSLLEGADNRAAMTVTAVVGLVLLIGIVMTFGGPDHRVARDLLAAPEAAADDDDDAFRPERQRMTLANIMRVCGGGGVAEAAAHTPGGGPRPMEIGKMREGKWIRHGENDRPLEEIELVGCRQPIGEPAVAECRYDRYPQLPIYFHNELVEVREARTGNVIASVTVPHETPGCPGMLVVRGGDIPDDDYPDDAATRFLVDNSSDGAMPALPLEDQVRAVCTPLSGVRRVPDAPSDPGAPVAVVVVHEDDAEVWPSLAGERSTTSIETAGYVICVTQGYDYRRTDDSGERVCQPWDAHAVRLHDGVVVQPVGGDPTNPIEFTLCGPEAERDMLIEAPTADSLAPIVAGIG